MSDDDKSDTQVLADRDSELYLQRPHLWEYQVCPVKRRREQGQLPEVGVVLRGHPIVYVATLFERLTPDTPRKEYDSYAALVADGWEVD